MVELLVSQNQHTCLRQLKSESARTSLPFEGSRNHTNRCSAEAEHWGGAVASMAKSEKRIKRKHDPAAAFHANLAMNQQRGCASPPISRLCDNVLDHILQLAEPDINIRQQLALVCKRWSTLTWNAVSFTTSSRSRLTSRAITSLVVQAPSPDP